MNQVADEHVPVKALVTGATGFLGSHLVEALCREGVRVRAVVRPGSDRLFAETIGAEVVTGDLADEASLVGACRGCDVVYHAAARVDLAGNEQDFWETTVEGTRRLLRAAGASGVRRFIQVSSCGIYHPSLLKRGEIIDEGTPTPEPPRWFAYGRSKYHAEVVVRTESPDTMEWVIARLSYVYGSRNRVLRSYLEPIMLDPITMLIGDGSNEMAFVHVADAAEALVMAGRAAGAARKVLLITGDEPVTQRRYFDALSDGFGVPRIEKRVPYGVAYLFCTIAERFVKSWPRRAALTRSAVALTGLRQRLRCDRTKEILGWRPTRLFADGMRESFDWYHSEKARATEALAKGPAGEQAKSSPASASR